MKIDGITLLTMIRDGKIKKGTKIYCSDFVEPYYFDGKTLYLKSNNYKLSLKDMLENLDYATYEIIEEKPKKIEEYKKNINLASSTNQEQTVKIFKYLCDFVDKINELTKVINYLLEKSDSE